MKKPGLDAGFKSSCPRCGHTLFHRKKETVKRTFAVAFTGFLLFLPTIFMPILQLKIVESHSSISLISGVAALWDSGMIFLAMIVFSFTIAAPFTRLFLLLYVSGSLYFNLRIPLVKEAFKAYLTLGEWSMLEVYLAGVVVSSVKLVDLATVNVGGGLYYLTALLIVIVGGDSVLDGERFWGLIDER